MSTRAYPAAAATPRADGGHDGGAARRRCNSRGAVRRARVLRRGQCTIRHCWQGYSLEYPVLEYPVLEYPMLEYPVLEYPMLECRSNPRPHLHQDGLGLTPGRTAARGMGWAHPMLPIVRSIGVGTGNKGPDTGNKGPDTGKKGTDNGNKGY
jgi:hypothetical protein